MRWHILDREPEIHDITYMTWSEPPPDTVMRTLRINNSMMMYSPTWRMSHPGL